MSRAINPEWESSSCEYCEENYSVKVPCAPHSFLCSNCIFEGDMESKEHHEQGDHD